MAGLVLCGALVGGLAGCSGALAVRGAIVQPARVPVRAFPRILVTADESPEADQLADAMARHLVVGRSAVRRVAPDEVEAMRAAGRLRRATVVVHVSLTITRHERPEWMRRETLDCGPLGCIETRRPYVEDVPVLRATLSLTVRDAETGRLLQREAVEDEEAGMDVLGMRLRVLERVRAQTLALLDQRAEPVVVELHPVDAPPVRRALARIGEGEWAEGRALLERFVRSAACDALPTDQRAIVLSDLGQARRFDTRVSAGRRLAAAARALGAAVRLVPAPRFASALADLEAHRRSRALVREQQEAMAHNFSLARADAAPPPGQSPADAIPAPPAGYR